MHFDRRRDASDGGRHHTVELRQVEPVGRYPCDRDGGLVHDLGAGSGSGQQDGVHGGISGPSDSEVECRDAVYQVVADVSGNGGDQPIRVRS